MKIISNVSMKIILIIILAIIGSSIGLILRLPIGPLIGAFTFTLIAQLSGLNVKPFPKRVKVIAQVIIGGVAGLNIKKEVLIEIPHLLIPSFISLAMHIAYSAGMAMILIKFFDIGKITSLCGVVPAGMSEITFIAQDVNADVQLVVIMHLYRVMLIITLLPLIIKFIF